MTTLTLEHLINQAMERADREDDRPPRDYIGASIIGTPCDRALWYGFRWYAEPQFPARIMRRFETGHIYEQRAIGRLRQAGFEVRAENPRARNPAKQWAGEYGPLGGLLRGHMDGFVRAPAEVWRALGVEDASALDGAWVLLEVKAVTSAKYTYREGDNEYLLPTGNKAKGRTEGRYFELARKGVKAAQPRHYAQMQAYMGFSAIPDRNGKIQWEKWGLDAPLERALYVAVNTDTDQYHAELVAFEPSWFRRIVERATQVIRAREAPARISENPASWDCMFCDFQEICHMSAPHGKTCRSCHEAELRIPGDHGYFGTTAQWICRVHKRSCGDYSPCDQHFPIPNEESTF